MNPLFNIRVYGLLVHDGRLLVADELINVPGLIGTAAVRITKFPGGGLEFGEGLKDCLIREVREEIGVEAFDLVHFYTTDFFQESAFRAGQQIISIYYTFRVANALALKVSAVPFNFKQQMEDEESFRWLDLATASGEEVTLPIDRVVLELLLKR